MVGFGIRWAFAFVLLAATYNPTGWNLTRWGMENWETQMPLTLFLGLLLLVGYIIYLRATLRSIGLFGMLLILLIAATFLWVLYDYGWISLEDPTVNTWIGLVLMSLVLGIGLNWSHVRRRLSGQSDMDDVDE
ncbi:DUF6524 family protein [Marivivens marinus]|uniref:DUF6524 family protein n=1 Tax=Marivivens marinus TaxID=3110173 RepID=UPI003B84739A